MVRCLAFILFALFAWAAASPSPGLTHCLTNFDPISGIAFSGRWLASGSYDGAVRLFTTNHGGNIPRIQCTIRDANDAITGVVLSGDGLWLAASSLDKMLRIYNMPMRKETEAKLAHELAGATAGVNALSLAGDSRWIVTGSEDSVARVYTLGDMPKMMYSLADATAALYAVAFSGDGRLIATGSVDKAVRIYEFWGEWCEPSLNSTLTEATDAITTMLFSGDSRVLAVGSADRTVRIYNTEWNEIPTLKYSLKHATGPMASLAFSMNNEWLATGSEDCSCRVYYHNVEEGAPILSYTLTDSGGSINALSFSADGRWLGAGAGDNQVRMYIMEGVEPPAPTEQPSIPISATSGEVFDEAPDLAASAHSNAGWLPRTRSMDGRQEMVLCAMLGGAALAVLSYSVFLALRRAKPRGAVHAIRSNTSAREDAHLDTVLYRALRGEA